ncbi:hypothetical protein CM49_00863 [Paenibacillus sp. P1XP2]|nr:hypothetical protein CM49_00863 [Paenibacillus sp. P1XP2]
MSNMHRIHWFDQRIRGGHYPSSRDLALQFEISRRQAQRDIEYLAVSLRAPLVYIAKHRGYGYEDKTYMLPHLYMTEEEKSVLKFLARKYGEYSTDAPSGVQRVAHLLGRFAGEEEGEGAGRLPYFDADPRLIHISGQLSFAIEQRRTVHLHYRSENGEFREDVCPVRLLSRYNADYVAAYREHEGKTRLYRLDAIESLHVTNRMFEINEAEDVPFVKGRPPAIQPFTARFRLDRELQGEAWHGYPARPAGDGFYDIDFYDDDAFLQQLLLGGWLNLVSPKWLKAKLQNRCGQILKCLDGEE